ncbi:MAG: cysteine--tRNA ligase [Victivallaceae bacterium]|nr:cysteine--tRNA ligase [Victivallaceae bacterium]
MNNRLTLFNTMSRRPEEFIPVQAGSAGMYTCGPTVYNFAHIGNFRAYTFEDLLHRVLAWFGYDVTQVMNLTDVDDKTIRDSRKAGLPLKEFTRKYIQAFFEDLKTLNITPSAVYPAATDHIPEMIALIQTLMDKGFAYQAEDKSIYFSIDKFPEYGKLAHIDRENQISGVRIKNDEYAKDSVADFALWKAWDAADGDVRWESPWGPGRPGWHVECSAMSMKYLGKTFDIHTGGVDNMFPHHEDEIAQSESANGCRYVNYWLHCAHLMVNGEKMSKSAGNFFTLRDLLAKGYSGRAIRWVLLSCHYRKKLNFTFEALAQAEDTLKKFAEFFQRMRELPETAAESGLDPAKYEDEFTAALGDDLNVSAALAVLFNLQRDANKAADSGALPQSDGNAILDLYRKFDRVLGCLAVDEKNEEAVPAEVVDLAEQRIAARKNKDWAASDRLRDEIKTFGYTVEDIPGGWYRLKK